MTTYTFADPELAVAAPDGMVTVYELTPFAPPVIDSVVLHPLLPPCCGHHDAVRRMARVGLMCPRTSGRWGCLCYRRRQRDAVLCGELRFAARLC